MTTRIATALAALAAAALAAALGGCTRFPEVDAADSATGAAAPAPRIVPVEPILARADATGVAPEDAARLAARAAGLRGRAAALRARSF